MEEADFREKVVRQLWNGRPLDEQDAPGRRQSTEPHIRAQLRALRWLTDIAQPVLTVALRELVDQGEIAYGRLAYAAATPAIEFGLWRDRAGGGSQADLRWTIAVAEDGSLSARSLTTGRRESETETIRSAGPNYVISVVLDACEEYRRQAWTRSA